MSSAGGVHFSFVVDTAVQFAYEGWHLARSLMEHCCENPARIHVQCTPEVDERTRALFRDQGYTLRQTVEAISGPKPTPFAGSPQTVADEMQRWFEGLAAR